MTNNYHLGFLFIVVVIVVGPSPCLHTVEAFSTVVYGPAMSTIELVLLTSKLSAKEGHNSYCVCAPGQETKYTTLMYGSSSSKKHAEEEKNDDANTNDDAAAGTAATTNRAIPVSSSEDIQTALLEADALILACYDTPLEEKALNTLLDTALAEGNDNLSQVVLISKMGVAQPAQQGGGFFGGGNKNKKLLDAETMIRSVCATKSKTIQKTIEVAIVRAGPLKGGGPGCVNKYNTYRACLHNSLHCYACLVPYFHYSFCFFVFVSSDRWYGYIMNYCVVNPRRMIMV